MRQARDAFGRPIVPSDAAPPAPRIAPRPETDGPQPAPQPETGADPTGPGDDPLPSSCLEQLWVLLKIVFVLFAIVSLVTKIVHHVGGDDDGDDSPAAVAEAASDADADADDAPSLYSRADIRLALDQVRSAQRSGDRVVSLVIGDGFVRLRLTAGRDRPIRELLLDSDGEVDGTERAGPNAGYRGIALSRIDAAAPGRLLADAELALTDADTVNRVVFSAGKQERRAGTWSAFVDRVPAEGETASRERWVGDAHGRHAKRGTASSGRP